MQHPMAGSHRDVAPTAMPAASLASPCGAFWYCNNCACHTIHSDPEMAYHSHMPGWLDGAIRQDWQCARRMCLQIVCRLHCCRGSCAGDGEIAAISARGRRVQTCSSCSGRWRVGSRGRSAGRTWEMRRRVPPRMVSWLKSSFAMHRSAVLAQGSSSEERSGPWAAVGSGGSFEVSSSLPPEAAGAAGKGGDRARGA